ncbi:MAG: EF-hand domain-containing protein [Pseudomonadota bacterium]
MRKTATIGLLAGVIGLGLAGAAVAQHRPGGHHGPRGEGGFAAGEAFARADANNDGRVTLDEGRTWLQARFAEADANRDGGVTIEELVTFMQARRPAGRPAPTDEMQARMREHMSRGFRFVDANGDGKVSMAELTPVAEAMFRAADRNADGALSREEAQPRRGGMGGHRHGGGPTPAEAAPPAR